MSKTTYEKNIYPMALAGLGGLSDHQSVDFIKRFVPEDFPVHVAVHQVSVATGENLADYSQGHAHNEEDELNVLISNTSLVYSIGLGDELHEVSAPASIWIPAGLKHSANVVSGEGFFLCLRFNKTAS